MQVIILSITGGFLILYIFFACIHEHIQLSKNSHKITKLSLPRLIFSLLLFILFILFAWIIILAILSTIFRTPFFIDSLFTFGDRSIYWGTFSLYNVLPSISLCGAFILGAFVLVHFIEKSTLAIDYVISTIVLYAIFASLYNTADPNLPLYISIGGGGLICLILAVVFSHILEILPVKSKLSSKNLENRRREMKSVLEQTSKELSYRRMTASDGIPPLDAPDGYEEEGDSMQDMRESAR
ncbi:hypothetical protein ADUPG1_000158, partial [Aduncisulcus paluster]